MKKFWDYIKNDFNGLAFIGAFGVLIAGIAIMAVSYSVHKYLNRQNFEIFDSYQVYCIDNVRYVSVKGMLTVKHDLSGEVETCELEEI